jgi:hypothetical protein
MSSSMPLTFMCYLPAESQLNDAEHAFAEAEKYLAEAKANASASQGAMWWIDRDLLEARKYMPTRAGGIAKKK